MPWSFDLRRRWSALLAWFRGRRGVVAPAPPALAPPAPAATGPDATRSIRESASNVPTFREPAPAVKAAVVPAASSVAAGEIVDAPVRTPRRARAPREVAAPVMDPALAGINVRQFFGRLVAATPAGLTIDFDEWQQASVERFFLAMTSPGLARRRESPTSGVEVLSVKNAFEGFEWD